MKKIASVILLLCMLISLFSGCSFGGGEKYTVMVYMVGSNLESEGMAASKDIMEMIKSEVDTNKVNLLIYTGGASMWYKEIANDSNSTFILNEEDGKKDIKLLESTSYTKNMGESSTLTEFLDYSYKNYPADHYGLICWDHGSGPLLGFGCDELYDNDSLDLSELQTALDNSKFNAKNKLDFIGFDACLMSSIEIADTVKNNAKYLIASQETEPGNGWDYSFLSTFNESFDIKDISKSIIDSYNKFYEDTSSYASNPDTTLSCVDLSKVDEVNKSLDSLFGKMKLTLDNGEYSYRAYERADCKSFGNESESQRGYSYDLVDIGDLAENCSSDFPDETSKLKSALNSLVTYTKSNIENCSGVSLYYPYNGEIVFAKLGKDKYSDFTSVGNYVDYIESFSRFWIGEIVQNYLSDRAQSITDTETTSDKLKVKLTDKQKKNFSKAYFNILAKRDDTHYTPILTDVNVKQDKNGDIALDPNQKIPVAYSSGDKTRWPLRQVSHSKGKSEYQSIFSKVSTKMWTLPYNASENVTVSCEVKDGNDKIKIKSIERDTETEIALGKNSVDPDKWSDFVNVEKQFLVTKDKDGNVLPFNKWNIDSGETVFFSSIAIDDDLELKMTSMSEMDSDEYYYQVVVEDTKGNKFVTDLMSVEQGKTSSEYKEKTSGGELTYKLYSDHAELINYVGKDKEVTIPEKVKGVPVTLVKQDLFNLNADSTKDTSIEKLIIKNPDIEFEYQAFYNHNIKEVVLPEGMKNLTGENLFESSAIEKITLPSTLEKISAYAFISCPRLRELTLPSSIKEIGDGAFGYCWFNKFAFNGDNANYKIENNALYSKDGKILYGRYDKGNSFEVPKGVEEIAPLGCVGRLIVDRYNDYEELADNTIKKLSLPDTLIRIDENAFRDCEALSINIPDSVEYVANNAFAHYHSQDFVTGNVFTFKSITIGKNVEWIGEEIIGDAAYDSIKVSKDNNFYAAKNGRLMNKSCDTEIIISRDDSSVLNKKEYEAHQYVAKYTDLKKYNKSKYESKNKSYKGKDYSLDYEIKEGNESKIRIDTKITLSGKTFTLPCTVSTLLNQGFRLNDESLKNKTLSADESEFYVDFLNDKGELFSAEIYNSSKKKQKLADCNVVSVAVNKVNSEKGANNEKGVEFSTNGISSSTSLEDVISKFGSPYEISLENQYDNTIRIEILYYDKDNNCLRVFYTFDQKGKTAKFDMVILNESI